MTKNLYDVAREATDGVLGEGTYAEINANHPDPGVQAAITKWREALASAEADREATEDDGLDNYVQKGKK